MKYVKWILSITLIVAVAGGGYYYKTEYIPRQFIRKFLKEMEIKKYSNNLDDFMFSKYKLEPLLSWDDFYANTKKDTFNLTDDQYFDVWKGVYLNRVHDYFSLSPDSPRPYALTPELIEYLYDRYNFSDFVIKKYAWMRLRNGIEAMGTVEVGYTTKTFSAVALTGSDGWKIISFTVD